jgi:putative copper resistance protein D
MILELLLGPGDPIRALGVAVRWLALVGALGACGATLFLVFLSEHLTTDEARATRRWLALFWLLAVLASAALWPFRAIELSGIRDGASRWPLYGEMLRSAFGDAFLLKAAGLVLLLFARVRTSWGAGIATAGVALVVLGLALAGHAPGLRQRQEAVALMAVHLAAVAFWFGCLFPLRNIALRRDPRSAAETLLVWSRQAMVFSALALATGAWAAFAMAGTPLRLHQSGYGVVVIAKSALVAAMLLGAFACRFRHVRLMQRGDVLAGDAFRRSCGRQIMLALVVLYLSAELGAADLSARN